MKNIDTKLMSAVELAEYMGITRNAAYTLLHRQDFPAVRIGTLIYAVRGEVDKWVRSQAESGGYHYGSQER